jgi:DNA-binding NtrC family response regulator
MSDVNQLQEATRMIRRGDSLVRRKIGLEVLDGQEKGTKVVMEGESLVIGGHPRCGLRISDPAVSRHHAEIRVVDRGLLLTDLDSTNGTFVGKLKVHEAILYDGVELLLGSTRIAVYPLDGEVLQPLSKAGRFGGMLGQSAAMRALFQRLTRAAESEGTVLLEGESGTGKEVAARAIHDASPRADAPFVVVDCGALPRELIESELFGHEKGAFTGATHSRQGAFEQANGGTLFLDEIGELDLELQPRLLRALESREVKRLGSNQHRPIDIRVIAGTNRRLQHQVAASEFREDLYYRLAVLTFRLPPLRERREDIPLLVDHFMQRFSGGRALAVSQEMKTRLMARPWPGNVRQLRNVVERAVALGRLDITDPSGQTVGQSLDDSTAEQAVPVASSATPEPAAAKAAPAAQTPAAEANIGGEVAIGSDAFVLPGNLLDQRYKIARGILLEQFERAYLEQLLARHDGNYTRSARAADINRVYLLRLLDKYDMRG